MQTQSGLPSTGNPPSVDSSYCCDEPGCVSFVHGFISCLRCGTVCAGCTHDNPRVRRWAP